MTTLLNILLGKLGLSELLHTYSVSDSFPELPVAKLKILARLRSVKSELYHSNFSYNLGGYHVFPHPFAVSIYKSFLEYNPNHLGNWSTKIPEYATHQLEYEVIHKMVDLYRGEKGEFEGYISTGGTEGNLFSLWLGRSYLEKFCPSDEICLIHTSLTHHSILKAANICRVRQYLVALDETNWGIHIDSLNKLIEVLIKKGKNGFLLPLTIGYPHTGTSDDIEKITQVIDRTQHKFKSIKFFLWIDAASDGLIEPFINRKFIPFKHSIIQTLVSDFHKYGLVPYPAGIILYRKFLRQLIEKKIDYFPGVDCTLIGSRPGIPAMVIWAMIQYLGKKGYRQIIKSQLENKNYFINQLLKFFPKTIIITHKFSLSCGIIFKSFKYCSIPSDIAYKYHLRASKIKINFPYSLKKVYTVYSFAFLSHVKKAILDMFINELRTQCKVVG